MLTSLTKKLLYAFLCDWPNRFVFGLDNFQVDRHLFIYFSGPNCQNSIHYRTILHGLYSTYMARMFVACAYFTLRLFPSELAVVLVVVPVVAASIVGSTRYFWIEDKLRARSVSTYYILLGTWFLPSSFACCMCESCYKLDFFYFLLVFKASMAFHA